MGYQLSEAKLIRAITRKSFFEFVKEFWEVVIPEKPVWNWHIELLCDELQKVSERVFAGQPKLYDLVVNISPGSTKSTIFSVMHTPWVWTRMPSARIINASHTHELVLDLSRKSRDIINSDKYRDCFPEIKLRDDQNTKGYFANTEGGFRLSCTVGGKTPTGFHAHFLNVDDPIDPMKAISDLEIKSANSFMNETLPTRKVDKKVSVTALIMQRLHQNDPSGNRLSNPMGGVRHICLPAEIGEDTKKDVKPPELVSKYVGGLMDPVRLPVSVLREAEATLGQYGYAGQFRQIPVPPGGGMFKVDRLAIGSPPELRRFKRLIRYWDKAGTTGGGAFTVGLLMGVDPDGRFWVLDVVRGQWDSSVREAKILQIAHLDGKKVHIGVEQEPGSGGKESAEGTVRRLAGYIVKVDIPKGDKELRADPYSVQVNNGNVLLKEGLWNKEYIEELRFFPFSTYKDQVDASSGAFAMLDRPRTKIGAM